MASATPVAVISLAGMLKYFKEYDSLIEKGDIKYMNGYVLQVHILDMNIEGLVRSSMGDKSYAVNIAVDGCGNILNSSCLCYRGTWLCSHVAATAIYVNKTGVSKTDLPNAWLVRPKKASKAASSIKLADHFPISDKKKAYSAANRVPDEEDIRFFHENLKDCSLKWILGPEPVPIKKCELEPEYIEEILPLFITDKERFVQKCKVTREQIQWVASSTRLQRDSVLWGRLRRLRLTGSNFGKVLDCYNRNALSGTPYPESLFKSLRGEYKMDGKESIMWGQMHEETAIKAYVAKTKFRVDQIGLCLFECGFLGSSPDGLVCACDELGVLEVKCPYKHRDFTVEEMIEFTLGDKKDKKDFFLKRDGSLNRQHGYWHQVQGEILAANVQWADFVVWTNKDLKIIRVNKDNDWSGNITKLSDFYINILLPKLYTSD